MRIEDLAVLTPILAAIGGAIAWWLQRSERRETRMIDFYKQRAEEAEKEQELWERRATAWYQQLLAAGITPDPSWGEKP